MKSILIKYRKGYLVYDEKCHLVFKNSINLKNNRIMQTKLPQVSSKNCCILDVNTLKPIYIKTINN